MNLKRTLTSALFCLTMAVSPLVIAQSIGGTPTGTFNLSSNPTSIDLTFTMEKTPGAGAGIYWAQQFWITNGPGGYLGLQTDGNAWNRNIGKMLIFSIWDTSTGRPSDGTYGTTFGGEGTGYSLRRPLDWQEGHSYRFRLAHEGQGWWGVNVTDTTSGQNIYLGAIQVPNSSSLQRSVTNFTEFYLNSSCTGRAYARVRFQRPVANGNDIGVLSNPTTYNICPNTANAYNSNGELVHEVGSCLATNSCDKGTVGPTNGTWLSGSSLRLMYADSQETSAEDGQAANAVDGNPNTIWHTAWYNSSVPKHPHEIQVDLGSARNISGVALLPRQTGSVNGMIKSVQVYVSNTAGNWGSAVYSGNLGSARSDQVIAFAAKNGRYVRIVALSEINGKPWTSLAELRVKIAN